MTGLMDAINEDTPITVILVDNATVGMTGGQPTAATGDKLAAYDLPGQPAFDGLIAAQNRLFLITRDNRVSCWE